MFIQALIKLIALLGWPLLIIIIIIIVSVVFINFCLSHDNASFVLIIYKEGKIVKLEKRKPSFEEERWFFYNRVKNCPTFCSLAERISNNRYDCLHHNNSRLR